MQSSPLQKYFYAGLASIVVQFVAIYCFLPNQDDFKTVSTLTGVDHSYAVHGKHSYTVTMLGTQEVYCVISIIGSTGGCGKLSASDQPVTAQIAHYISLFGEQDVLTEAKIGDHVLLSKTPNELLDGWIKETLGLSVFGTILALLAVWSSELTRKEKLKRQRKMIEMKIEQSRLAQAKSEQDSLQEDLIGDQWKLPPK